ncbi:hypothetical protein SAY87_002380 [Trapa incisa]|uniref:Gag1-like clamp domain-containing protein n=1 Tax=Trapa incisa TaxID=236973 RepID=A0AAN7PUU3_9MYRT|nr:hypothetical protein SAY87_002380 [Trapa incisa]
MRSFLCKTKTKGFTFPLPLGLPRTACMGGCLVCCSKLKLKSSAGSLRKGRDSKDRGVQNPNNLEDFWSSSVLKMENSTVMSQGSISSISISNQTLDPPGGQGSSGTPELINHGLLLWNQNRQQWLSNKKNEMKPRQSPESKLSCNVTYECLLGSNKPFPQPIPLSEMVDFLVDTWEQEGMYD